MDTNKIDWEKERANAIMMGMVMDVNIGKALEYVEKMSPFMAIIDKLPNEKTAKNVDIDFNSLKTQLQNSINTWLTTFDDVLKVGKSLPVDLIGKAADLARKIREEENEQKGTSTTG